jgi:hypothetical protein
MQVKGLECATFDSYQALTHNIFWLRPWSRVRVIEGATYEIE